MTDGDYLLEFKILFFSQQLLFRQKLTDVNNSRRDKANLKVLHGCQTSASRTWNGASLGSFL